MLTKASETVQLNGLQHDIQVSGRNVAVRIAVSPKEIFRDLSKHSAGLKKTPQQPRALLSVSSALGPEGPTEA